MNLCKKNFFNLLLLLLLSIKISHTIYRSVENFTQSEEISSTIDLEESENEEEKELKEAKKINQKVANSIQLSSFRISKNHLYFLKRYKVCFIEYTPPPPEFS